MDYLELKQEFDRLGDYKTKDIDKLNRRLIKENIDVSFLKDFILKEQEFHRTYFQVELGLIKNSLERLSFIEENCYLLNDWWHVDQLTQFVGPLDLDEVYRRTTQYVNHPHPFMRRWGYVIYMPTLVKDEKSFDLIVSLLKNDDEYYVVMAEAWLISYLAIYHPSKTYEYLSNCNLDYNIVGKAIQKILDSFRISDEWKEEFKLIRKKYKKY